MGTEQSLDFITLIERQQGYNKRRNRVQKVQEVINDELEELSRRIYEYNSGGKMVVTLSIKPDSKKNKLKACFDIKSEMPGDKIDTELWQDDRGKLYAGEPGQTKLDLVPDINSKKNSEKTTS